MVLDTGFLASYQNYWDYARVYIAWNTSPHPNYHADQDTIFSLASNSLNNESLQSRPLHLSGIAMT